MCYAVLVCKDGSAAISTIRYLFLRQVTQAKIDGTIMSMDGLRYEFCISCPEQLGAGVQLFNVHCTSYNSEVHFA
jgi:hypothetical protein